MKKCRKILLPAIVSVILLAVLITAVFLTAYWSAVSQTTFYAEILSTDGEHFRVLGLDANDINSRGQFRFSISDRTIIEWHNTRISASELEAGDTVSVAYFGSVRESDPAGIDHVLKIVLLDDEK